MLVLVSVALVSAWNVKAQAPLPKVIDGGVSAPAYTGSHVVTKSLLTQNVDTNPTLEIFPSFGPPTYAASFLFYGTNAVATVRNLGSIPTGVRTTPTDVRLLQIPVVEDFLTTAPTVPFYRGDFAPQPPWDKENGGLPWFWVLLKAASGKTVSMSSINATLNSTDPNNLLGKSVNFSTNGYGIAAWGVMPDGTLINQGQPSSTQVQRVIVGIGSKSFPVKNQGDIATVVNYLAPIPDWSEIITVSSGATVVSRNLRKGIPRPNLIPSIVFSGREKRFQVVAENTGLTGTFPLQYSINLTNWVDVGTIAPGQTNFGPIQANSNPQFFMRIKP